MYFKDLEVPKHWKDFEELCRDVWESSFGLEAKLYGRGGQFQSGIDILGKFNSSLIAIQCKFSNENKSISLKTINEEIKKAESFELPLSKLIIATTRPKDTKIERLVFDLSIKRENQGFFSVELYSWQDILPQIMKHDYIIKKYYPHICNPLSCPLNDFIKDGYSKRPIFEYPKYINNNVNAENLLESALFASKFGIYTETIRLLNLVHQKDPNNENVNLLHQHHSRMYDIEYLHSKECKTIISHFDSIKIKSKLFKYHRKSIDILNRFPNENINSLYQDAIFEYPLSFFMYHNWMETNIITTDGFEYEHENIRLFNHYFKSIDDARITFDLLSTINYKVHSNSSDVWRENLSNWSKKYKSNGLIGKWCLDDLFEWGLTKKNNTELVVVHFKKVKEEMNFNQDLIEQNAISKYLKSETSVYCL